MKLRELLPGVESKFENIDIKGVTCNSKEVQEGFAFICINGTNVDGHKFAASAVQSGAAVIVCERDLGLENQIIVDDTHAAYADMSANWFGNPASKIKLVGVTGTNGKTSVVYMLKAILEKAGNKIGVIGTIQNMVGDKIISSNNTTPGAYELNALLAQMVDEGCRYAVMEVSSHALDQKRIHNLSFEVAAFTNLTQDHLDYHITMDNYFLAKTKLFTMSKTAVVNVDDAYGKKLVDMISGKVVSFSVKQDSSTYTAKEVFYKPDSVKYQMVGYNFINKIRVGTGGKFTVYNSLCAVACAIELGVDMTDIIAALSEMHGVKGRAEVVPTNRDFTVIIDYAHTPDGLENILATFKEFRECRLVVVFGCGGDRDKTKRPIMGEIAARYADYVIVTSDNPRSEEPMSIINDIVAGIKDSKKKCKIIENRAEAVKFAIATAGKNDIIVLAGKGHETYQILSTGKIHLDEREIVKECLEQ